jgi:hypothetical protein
MLGIRHVFARTEIFFFVLITGSGLILAFLQMKHLQAWNHPEYSALAAS